MAEPTTTKTGASVAAFIKKLPDPDRRSDCQTVVDLMRKATNAEPEMWGSGIVGFGKHTYGYKNGRALGWFKLGFAPRAHGLTLYLQTGFVFTELFVLPVLAPTVPQFIVSALGVANGVPGEMDIGAFVPTYNVVGITYLLGGLLFGIAVFRARVLPRWPSGLLAVTALVTPAAVLVPHAIQRFAAVPMGIALAGLGYALWSERRA
jgi:hypothetical protein